MDKNTLFVLNDLLDAVETLSDIVGELNPGATEQLGLVDFLLGRSQRYLDDTKKALDQS
jgi:hypothetical protein